MTNYPDYPNPSSGRRRVPFAAVAFGIAVALLMDAGALAAVPGLRAAWERLPAVSPVPTLPITGHSPATHTPSPATQQPSATRRASALPSGPVPLSAGLERGIVAVDAMLTESTTSAGTGMVLTSDGEIITNYHVVRSSISITVTVFATQQAYTARLVGRDAARDVALLQLQHASGLRTVTPDRDPVVVGDPVVAAGNAAGLGELTAFAGRIVDQGQSIRVRGASSDDPEENLTGLLETDAHAEPGDSGGPLFDAENEVLGVTTAGSSTASDGGPTSGRAYAVPIATALAVVAQIRTDDTTGGVVIGPKAVLGVNAVNDDGHGVRVTNVVSGGAASRTGLRVGDVITSLAGHAVATLADLMADLDLTRPGQTVQLQWVTSEGEARSSPVTLDASHLN